MRKHQTSQELYQTLMEQLPNINENTRTQEKYIQENTGYIYIYIYIYIKENKRKYKIEEKVMQM